MAINPRLTKFIRTTLGLLIIGWGLFIIGWLYFAVDIVWDQYEYLGDGTGSPLGQEILEAADELTQYIENESWHDLYAVSAAESRKESQNAFISHWQKLARGVDGFEEVEILEIHVVTLTDSHIVGSGYHMRPVLSEVLPPAVALTSPVGGRQAFVLCKGMTDGGKWPTWLTLTLKQEDENWRLLEFFHSPAIVAGHDGQWFWQKAQGFESEGQHRNAYFYGVYAYMLLTPSTAFASVSGGEINSQIKDRSPLNLPFPEQRPAEDWPIADDLTVKVFFVRPVANGTLLWLEFRYRTLLDDLESNEAKSERKQVYEYVVTNFPEYQDAFGGIYIGSTHGGRGFGEGFPFDETGPSLTPNWNEPP